MTLTAITIDHKDQRYPTVGDWQSKEVAGKPEISVLVSNLGYEDYNFLIAIHELIEAYLCWKRGITDEEVTRFDKRFEELRKDKEVDGEPGDDPYAPYKREHFFATNIERQLAHELGVDWGRYEERIGSL
jgi:hypothetical protein